MCFAEHFCLWVARLYIFLFVNTLWACLFVSVHLTEEGNHASNVLLVEKLKKFIIKELIFSDYNTIKNIK